MKRTVAVLLMLLCLLMGCERSMTMNSVLDEPHFCALVQEVRENSLLVLVNEDEEARGSSDLIVVSLDVQLKDGLSEYEVGDEVCVYYDGSIAESYPAQVDRVYAITIVTPVDRAEEEAE